MEWLAKISGVLEAMRTPLMLAGLVVIILYALYKQILGMDIFHDLNQSNTYQILDKVLNYLFILAIVAIVLGFAGYLIARSKSTKGNT